jgi:hypothetical protein
VQAPALGHPCELTVRSRAAPAVDAALTVPRLLAGDGRPKRARRHRAVERERVPRLDLRHPERAGRTCEELFGGLGHDAVNANVGSMHARLVTSLRNVVVVLSSFFLLAVG